jgi:hypothetical protein
MDGLLKRSIGAGPGYRQRRASRNLWYTYRSAGSSFWSEEKMATGVNRVFNLGKLTLHEPPAQERDDQKLDILGAIQEMACDMTIIGYFVDPETGRVVWVAEWNERTPGVQREGE